MSAKLKIFYIATTCIIVGLIFLSQKENFGGRSVISNLSNPSGEESISAVEVYKFLSLAFTDKIWNEEFSEKIFSDYLKSYLSQDEIAQQVIPDRDKWSAPYLNPARELPDNGTIHKWDVDVITVGLGPPFDKSYVENEHVQESYALVIEQFDRLKPILEKKIGKKVELITPENEKNLGVGYGHIRIIPMKDIGRPGGWFGFSGPPFLHYESRLWGAELFESSDPDSLRGFLLPNADNSLAFSICKVRMGVDAAIFRQSVDECLIRSMGLPGSFSDLQKKSPAFPQDEYLEVLSILYCPDIKSGMSKNKAIRFFALNHQCGI